MRLLLEKQGIDVNVMDDNNDTPLHVAAKHGHADIVSLLLAKEGIELNPLNKNGIVLVMPRMGIQKKQLLAKDGIDVNKSGEYYGFTPLRIVAQKEEVVKQLLDKEELTLIRALRMVLLHCMLLPSMGMQIL